MPRVPAAGPGQAYAALNTEGLDLKGRADLSRQPGDWPGQDPRARLPVRALSSGRVTACPGNRIPSRRDSSSRGYSWPFEAERGGKLQVTRG